MEGAELPGTGGVSHTPLVLIFLMPLAIHFSIEGKLVGFSHSPQPIFLSISL